VVPGEQSGLQIGQSGLQIGIGRYARRSYGFDEVALVPGGVTLNPDEVDISFALGDRLKLPIPIWGSAMDGVVDVEFAIAMGKLGGIAVLNLDGVHTRYEDSAPIIKRIAEADKAHVNALLKEVYREPVKPQLISERINAIKAAGVACAVSTIPARAAERAELAQKAGADVLVVQGTVLTARHSSRSYHQLSFEELVRACDIPVVVGNCVHYETALELMETGIAGILVGVGPGAACTTRGVLGVGVPQVTATADVAAARDEHMRRGGMRVAVITDGGMVSATTLLAEIGDLSRFRTPTELMAATLNVYDLPLVRFRIVSASAFIDVRPFIAVRWIQRNASGSVIACSVISTPLARSTVLRASSRSCRPPTSCSSATISATRLPATGSP